MDEFFADTNDANTATNETGGGNTEDMDGVLVGNEQQQQQSNTNANSISMGMGSSNNAAAAITQQQTQPQQQSMDDYAVLSTANNNTENDNQTNNQFLESMAGSNTNAETNANASANANTNPNTSDSNNTNTNNNATNNASSNSIALGLDSNPYEQQSKSKETGDFFAGLGGSNEESNEIANESDNKAMNNNNNGNNEELKDNAEKTDDEPTFLSVWQEQRRNELDERRAAEREKKNKLLEEAQQNLEQFNADRAARMASKQKDNRLKENQLREDLDSTFKHGTIWEQVGKMVNLQEKPNNADNDRMRVLLIHLKNMQSRSQNNNNSTN